MAAAGRAREPRKRNSQQQRPRRAEQKSQQAKPKAPRGAGGKRPRAEPKQQRKRTAKPKPARSDKTHPTVQTQYGELRIQHVVGHPSTWYTYELVPSEMSKLPPGALRASPLRQVFGLGGPKLFYVDSQRRCRSCKHSFVFSAKEQRHWYETLKFFDSSYAIDCLPCRRKRREERKLLERHSAIANQARAAPDDAQGQLAVAKLIFALRSRFLHGNLNAGIAAARKARRLDPNLVEALYWEGRLQELAQRHERARSCLQQFRTVAEKLRSKAVAKMRREANLLLGK